MLEDMIKEKNVPSAARESFVDILKGIAIILVVIGHFYPKDAQYGFWSFIHALIYSFHMPLFMMVSGYLYERSVKIHSFDDYFRFLRKKWQRLLAPYFAISAVVILIKVVAQKYVVMENPVTLEVFKYLLINPQGGPTTFLWYIYTLFVIFLIFPLIRLFIKNTMILSFLILLLHFMSFPEVFCLNLVAKYLLYFWCGIFSFHHLKDLAGGDGRRYRILLWFGLFIGIFLAARYILYEAETLMSMILAIVGSMSFLLLAISLEKNRLGDILRHVGIYSTSIYLLHTTFMAPVKMSLNSFFISGPVEFIVSVLLISFLGIVAPILISIHFFDKSRFFSLLFFGMEPIKNKG